jgi:hypothetical protein
LKRQSKVPARSVAAREAKQNDENKEDFTIAKRVTAAFGAELKGDPVSFVPA